MDSPSSWNIELGTEPFETMKSPGLHTPSWYTIPRPFRYLAMATSWRAMIPEGSNALQLTEFGSEVSFVGSQSSNHEKARTYSMSSSSKTPLTLVQL